MIKKINHVAVVVENLEGALGFWRDALGLPVARTERNEGEDVNIAFMPVGESEIELLEPISPDGSIAKYITKRGQGIHHLCVEVADIDAMIERLKGQGVMLINDTPKVREEGTRYVFVHPKSTGGVLVELYELPQA